MQSNLNFQHFIKNKFNLKFENPQHALVLFQSDRTPMEEIIIYRQNYCVVQANEKKTDN